MALPPGLVGFVHGRNQQGQEQAQQLGMLAQLAQLSTVARQQQQQDAITGILSQAPTPEAAIPLLMKAGPLGVQAASSLTQLAKQQADAKLAADKTAFFSPENRAKYVEGGRPEITLPETEQGPVSPAVPGKMNFSRFMEDAASRGVVNPETYANHLAQREQAKATLQAQMLARRDSLEARLLEIQTRSEDRALDRTQREQLAREAIQARREMAAIAASLKQPPQPRPLQLTTDAAGNQLIVNPDGTTRPLTSADGSIVRSPKVDKPLNEFQGKSTLYGTRAAQSDKILRSLEGDISTTGLAVKQGLAKVPVIGGALGAAGNVALSGEQQRVEQAQRDFVNAVLRQESGAVISDAEFDNAKKQYFPQPGDNKATVNQKRANRMMAIQGFARMAGAGGEDIRALINSPLLPSQPKSVRPANVPPPPPGFVVNE